MGNCPTPTKARYATREAADKAAATSEAVHGRTLRPYECVCTWWHLTRSAAGDARPDAADATEADIQRLTLLPDIDFREIVALDASGKGSPEDGAALRHPRVLLRWRRALGQLINELDTRLSSSRGDKTSAAKTWRIRAAGYRASLELRIAEAQRLRAEAAAKGGESAVEAGRRSADAARAAGCSVSELRSRAGDVAIRRLIEAHPEEWGRLLSEEFLRLGLEVPDRVARHLPSRRTEDRAQEAPQMPP